MISVIIPVFNNSDLIEKAVTSALMQEEVFEVIVINDGSTDGTTVALENLQHDHARLKVLYHVNKENRGRSASRNLGIRSAKGKYIAFLDSDDFYLFDRFKKDISILEHDESIDGVYNGLGVHFYREFTQEEYKKLELTSVRTLLSPEELFSNMEPIGNQGYFSGDSLTVRRSIFNKVGLFNEQLAVGEDTNLWIRMALKAKLVPGIIDRAVTMRGVHDENVFNNQGLYDVYRRKSFEELVIWAIENEISNEQVGLLWSLYFKHSLRSQRLRKEILSEVKMIYRAPSLLFKSYFLKENAISFFFKRK
jgi:glycosyltransferase involved in cell wall biosynthesis